MQRSGWMKKLEELNARGATRSLRRFVVLIWLLAPAIFCMTAVIDLRSWHDSGRLYGVASCISCFTAIMLATVNMRLNRRALLGVSRDDVARTLYAKPYVELNEMQRDRVIWRLRQEYKKGDRALDEREVVMRREAERRAYRILRVTRCLWSRCRRSSACGLNRTLQASRRLPTGTMHDASAS